MSMLGAVKNLLGIKGVDGTNIASPTNPVPAQLYGSAIDRRGLIADRPAAADLDNGIMYWAVDRIDEDDEFSVVRNGAWENF